MSTLFRTIAACAAGTLWLLSTAAGAQPGAPVPQAGVPDAADQAVPVRRAEAVARVTVIEDDGVRIEETRLRGAPQRIRVQSKLGNAREYEIIVGRGGRDPSQDRGAAGQRAWSVLGF